LKFFRTRRTYRTALRIKQIISVFLKYGFGRVIDQIRLSRYIPFITRLRTFGQWPALKVPAMAERIRLAFEELGPSFIKLAQILSARPDLIGVELADELKKLQDEVPPFPAEEAIRMIETELGKPISQLFSHFHEQPLAAASIAQVHAAVLKDGSRVVVKVQRPAIQEIIYTDMEIMGTIARLMERYMPESRFFNPRGIIEEFAKTIRKELNFREEARNCDRFRRNFQNEPDIYFPQVYWDYTTDRVFVMERLEGVRIDNTKEIDRLGYDKKRLARLGVDAYFKMIFEDGFFHADPHPGNIFVMPTQQLGFMDFGIVGRVSEELKRTMANTLIALINRDFDRLIDSYIDLGLVPEETDPDVFRREFKADLVDFLEPLYGLTIGQINFAQSLQAVVQIAIKHNMRMPTDLLLIDKVMIMLESIGLQLDPAFDFIAASEPYASKLVREKYNPAHIAREFGIEIVDAGEFAIHLPRHLRNIIRKVLRNDIHFKLHHLGLDSFIKDMDRASNRLAFAIVISALIISSAIMNATGVPPRLFGQSVLGWIGFVLAGLLGIWLLISIIRSGRL
jgi:ubiquinone biosynthesis protein